MRTSHLLAAALLFAAAARAAGSEIYVKPNTSRQDVVTTGASASSNKVLVSTGGVVVFGSTTPAAGLAAVLTASGTLVVQSTSTAATQPVLQIRDQGGAQIWRTQQNGRVKIGAGTASSTLDVTGTVTATAFAGDGSALAGVPGQNSTTTWTAPQFYASSVNISSPTSSLIVGSSATFNGAAIFSSSITFNSFGSVYSSSLTMTGNKINDWNAVGFSSFTGSSALYIYNFQSTTSYRGQCEFMKHTLGHINLQMSGDTGSVYDFGAWYEQGTNAHSYVNADNGVSIPLSGGSSTWATETPGSLVFEKIKTKFGRTDRVTIFWKMQFDYDALGNPLTINGTGAYNGTTTFSSLKIFPSAGTMDGWCVWEMFVTTR